MPDEDFVLDLHSFADEGVGGNLAIPADDCAPLNFHESPDLAVVADRAPVEIYKSENLDIFAQADIG